MRGRLAGIVIALAMPATAAAQGLAVDLVSTGPAGGNALIEPQEAAYSADGNVAVFTTAERLTAGDTDDSVDVYMRAAGTTVLMSAGERNGNGAFDATTPRISRDGSRVYFTTSEQLSFADNDSAPDVYTRAGDSFGLVSGGPANSNEPATFLAASSDGARALIATKEALLPAQDKDALTDIYERDDDGFVLRTPGTAAELAFAGATPDLSKVYISTAEALLPDQDSDAGGTDIYEATAGGYRLISTAAGKPDSTSGALALQSVAEDGSRVVVGTGEQLVAADADATIDFYSVGAATQLLSVGPAGGNAAIDAAYYGASRDGRTVAFSTVEALTAGDKDASRDIYVNRDGTLELASPGSAKIDVTAAGGMPVSADGRGVLFTTTEQLVPQDTDTVADLYEHIDGNTRLVSQGELPSAQPVAGTGSYAGSGADDVYFQTTQPLTRQDVDSNNDFYVRSGGTLTRLFTPGTDDYDVVFSAFPLDGGRLFFLTREQLVPEDSDDSKDIYSSRFATPPPPPPPADTTPPSLALSMTPRTFRFTGRKALFVQAARRTPSGATITVTTSEAGRINLAFSHRRKGRRGRDGRCHVPTRKLRHRRRCTRFAQVPGGIALTVNAGTSKLRFFGRLDGPRRLKPGRYAVFARAYDNAGNASPLRHVLFRAVRR